MHCALPRRIRFAAPAVLLILAAVLANVGFSALGSIFNYPDVLNEPAGQVLASFRDHEAAVSTWFVVLAFSAVIEQQQPDFVFLPHTYQTRDFAPALEQFLGTGAGLSASSITRLTTQWRDRPAP